MKKIIIVSAMLALLCSCNTRTPKVDINNVDTTVIYEVDSTTSEIDSVMINKIDSTLEKYVD